MNVRVLAFASAREAIGASQVEIELADSSRLEDLAQHLKTAYPALGPIWSRLAIALDGEMISADTALWDGVEVALLPPVSGGSGPPLLLVDEPLDASSLARQVGDDGNGATVLFIGTVRNHHQNRPVDKITYDAYRRMAAKKIAAIITDLESSEPGLRVAIVHRLGEILVGDASVAIAVSSPHREASYAASRTALERLKQEVPIWKQEHYEDGETVWREEESLV